MAASAASRARFSPVPAPMPIIAMPLRTSPSARREIDVDQAGRVISSAMPATALSSTSFLPRRR